MRLRALLPIVAAVVVTVPLALSGIRDESSRSKFTFRITSEKNDPVSFEAVYVFDMDSGVLHKEVLETPVDLQGWSDTKTYAGIFRKMEGIGNLRVEVLDEDESSINTASGTFISLTPHGVDVWSF